MNINLELDENEYNDLKVIAKIKEKTPEEFIKEEIKTTIEYHLRNFSHI